MRPVASWASLVACLKGLKLSQRHAFDLHRLHDFLLSRLALKVDRGDGAEKVIVSLLPVGGDAQLTTATLSTHQFGKQPLAALGAV